VRKDFFFNFKIIYLDLNRFYWDLIPRRAEITWAIPTDIGAGSFRIRHFGLYRLAVDAPSKPYFGSTRTFNVR
jgi:hypothetical protein